MPQVINQWHYFITLVYHTGCSGQPGFEVSTRFPRLRYFFHSSSCTFSPSVPLILSSKISLYLAQFSTFRCKAVFWCWYPYITNWHDNPSYKRPEPCHFRLFSACSKPLQKPQDGDDTPDKARFVRNRRTVTAKRVFTGYQKPTYLQHDLLFFENQ